MLFGTSARAEEMPNQFNNLFEIIESFILQGGLMPSTIGGGGCKPALKLGFPVITLQFSSDTTCNLSGDIRFSLIPFGAMVRLEIKNNPNLQSIEMDFGMKLRRSNGIQTFTWSVLNGHVAFRMKSDGPLYDWNITGMGQRVRSRDGLNVSRRLNFFDKATGSGTAIAATITWPKKGKRVVTRQFCTLTGAVAADPNSGTLSACGSLLGQ